MRTSIASAAFLLLGAGAVAVSADDTTGSNLALSGSDTLLKVTRDVLAACDGTVHYGTLASSGNVTGDGMSYVGGGSGIGANAMALNQQRMAPMSRALKNIEYCNNSLAYTLTSQATTNALMVGVDGVSIMANAAQACSGDLPNNSSGAANSSFTYTSTASGNPTKTYTITNSLDLLRLAFAGTDAANLSYEGDYGCGGPIRKALLANWSALFSGGNAAGTCAAGTHRCDGSTTGSGASAQTQPVGLTHLWRRSDLSGTTDAFVTLVNLGVRKVGNNPAATVYSFSYTVNPFCNTVDANSVPPVATAAGVSCTATSQCPTLWGSKCVSGVCSGTKLSDTANLDATGTHIAIPCNLTTTTSTQKVGGTVLLTNPNNINQDCQVPGDTFMDPTNVNTGIAMQDSVCQQGPVLSGDGTTSGATNDTVRTGVCHPGSLATFSDYLDNDPIRVFCDANAAGDVDAVCNVDGKLGAVLPVYIPDPISGGTPLSQTDMYPTAQCDATNTCKLTYTSNDTTTDTGPCPAGGPRLLGRCFMPVQTVSPGNFNFNCIALSSSACFGDTSLDGRVYNLAFKRNDPTAGAPGGYVTDSAFALMKGSFLRIHQNFPSSYAASGAGSSNCQQLTDTTQIGCLVEADPCSAGYAGREADQVGGSLNKALTVNTIAPRTTTSTPDSTISELIDGVVPPVVTGAACTSAANCTTSLAGAVCSTTTNTCSCNANSDCLSGTTCNTSTHVCGSAKCGTNAPCASGFTCNSQFGLCYPSTDIVYPLARRLYVASDIGMANLLGGEFQLAKCYADNNLMTAIMQADNFVPVPGGVQCLDYPEASSAPATSVYLASCSGASLAGTNTNACANMTGFITH